MRRRRQRSLVAAVITVTLTAGMPAGLASAEPASAGAAPKPTAQQRTPVRAAEPVTVTLITGDRITAYGGNRIAVTAGPGRTGMRFHTHTVGGHQHVVPADAQPLLRAGRLDPRLFDVTALGGFGYDDRSAELPLLVSYPGAGKRPADAARSAASVDGARVVRDLPAVGALAVRADRAGRTRLWSALTTGAESSRALHAGVDKIWLDGKRKVNLDVSVPQIGAPAAWQAGFDGTGVTVAVLDTGIDATHPDLIGQIAASQNFTDAPDADDRVGHGTHVASTIAGTGAASGGRYRGVAPGAKLLGGKVCADESCTDSAILAGMQWAAERGAQVVNMSLGGPDAPDVDPLEQAVEDLTARYGALFVVAAGNSGEDATVGSPASADAALAVGAVDRDNQLADFSSRGPRVGDDAVKPEITAPGVAIVAAKAAHDVIGDPAPVDRYTTMSGTSMATPHVAGAAAIVAQQHRTWTPRQRKTALMVSAAPTPGLGVFSQGAGRVDLTRAIGQFVTTDDGAVSFGRQLWPHGDDQPITRTVTYRNDGPAAVTLSLAIEASRPDGSAAPSGVFTVGADRVTVPAGGRAQVTLTADTRVDGPDGVYSGRLVGTAAGVRVQTPFAVQREPESYDVTFAYTGRDGADTRDAHTVIVSLDRWAATRVDGSGATTTVRLQKGSYGLYTEVTGGSASADPADDTATTLVQPKFVVDKPLTVRPDARLGRPLTITVPDPRAASVMAAYTAQWTGDAASPSWGGIFGSVGGQFVAHVGPQVPTAEFYGQLSVMFVVPAADGSLHNVPTSYDLVWFSPGRMFTGLTRAIRPRDLAAIAATYAREATGVSTYEGVVGVLDLSGGVMRPLTFDAPFRRTKYVNTEGGVQWESVHEQSVPRADGPDDLLAISYLDKTTYRPGRTYRQDWNRAVLAPSVADPPWWGPDAWVSRTGDTMFAGPPLYTDSDLHAGDSAAAEPRIALYRDGELVGDHPESAAEFPVPAGEAAYRLEVSARRTAPHTLSTSVSGVWTFRSARAAGDDPVRLPLSSVRFTPAVDLENTAPAGRRVDIGVYVDRQDGSSAGGNRSLAVDVSYDDGRTWQRAQVRGRGDHRTATVRHPDTPGFTSLRARATDTAGNTVTQTVIRAYRIG